MVFIGNLSIVDASRWVAILQVKNRRRCDWSGFAVEEGIPSGDDLPAVFAGTCGQGLIDLMRVGVREFELLYCKHHSRFVRVITPMLA